MATKANKIRNDLLSVWLVIFLSAVLACTANCRSDNDMSKPSESNEKVKSASSKSVLTSALAGSWYPGDEKTLSRQLTDYFARADVTAYDNVIGLILPHAGYQYSGATAAAGVKTVGTRKYQRIVVLGPSHHLPMEDVLSVPDVTHYRTPLGEVRLDLKFIAELKKHSLFQTLFNAHAREHSVQIEVPMLQQSQHDFALVPIVVGSLSRETVVKAAAILRGLIDENTLVVASSDFTHYGARFGFVPFRENIPQKIKELDMGAFEFIAQRDVAGFLDYRAKTGATICGTMPIAVLLAMLPADSKAILVKYDTSGNLTGDFENSVSYLSVAFTGQWSQAEQVTPESPETILTEKDKKELLTLARRSFTYYIEHQQLATAQQLGFPVTDAMKQVRATFVTLHKDHMLRGCIGEIFPSQPLYKSVLVNAVKAAVNDYRFPVVTRDECPQLHVEISVLTPPVQVQGFEDIVIGKHGVVLTKSGRSAVFLPQGAPEQGWNLEQTLSHLSLKAGLDRNAWKEGAQFLVFEAIVFGEESPATPAGNDDTSNNNAPGGHDQESQSPESK